MTIYEVIAYNTDTDIAEIYADKNLCDALKTAYKCYVETWKAMKEEHEIDIDNSVEENAVSLAEFTDTLIGGDDCYIQSYNYHIEYRLYKVEI